VRFLPASATQQNGLDAEDQPVKAERSELTGSLIVLDAEDTALI
jgi:hypothetical protein